MEKQKKKSPASQKKGAGSAKKVPAESKKKTPSPSTVQVEKVHAEGKKAGPLVIDASNFVLGRLAAFTAKRLLSGEKVTIVNAGEAVITGSREYLFRRYKQRVDRRNLGNPTLGPHFPKSPEGIVHRAVRGMLDYSRARGKTALANLRVYYNVPRDCGAFSEIPLAPLKSSKYVKIFEISRYLGWKG